MDVEELPELLNEAMDKVSVEVFEELVVGELVIEELAVDVGLLNEVTAAVVGVMTGGRTDVIVGPACVVVTVIETTGCVLVTGGLVCGIAGKLRLLSALKEG